MTEKRLALDQIPLFPGVANARGVKLMGSGESLVTLGATGGDIDVPGTTVAFTLEVAQTVIIAVACRGNQAQTANGAAHLFYSIDAVDFPGPFNLVGTAGATNNDIGNGTLTRAHFLAAGLHTVKGRANNAGGPNNQILAPITVAVLATNEDLGGGGGSLVSGGSTLVKEESVVSAGGIVTNSLFTYVDVPGSIIAFTLDEPKTVLFIGNADAYRHDAGGGGQNTQLGLSVDGTDYHGTSLDNATLPSFLSGTLAVHRAITLLAGPHTIKLRYRRHQAGNPASAQLLLDSDHHAVLTAVYTEAIFGIGSLASQEAVTSGAPGTVFDTASTSFVPVPGTLINLSLLTQQTVFFVGQGSDLYDGAFRTGTQIGIRVDGVDYAGSVSDSHGLGQGVTGGFSSSAAVLLAAGPHTAELVIRVIGAVTVARIFVSSNLPARLTALYSDPQDLVPAGVGALSKQEAENVTGTPTTTSSTTFVLIPNTAVSFTLATVQEVLFEGFATAETDGGNIDINTEFGVRVDGIDYPGTSALRDGIFILVATRMGLKVTKMLSLAPGLHTAQLVLRRSLALGTAAHIMNAAGTPSRLTAIYTDPEAINPGLFGSMAKLIKVDGDLAISPTGAGVFVDLPGLNSVFFTPTVTGDAMVFLSGTIGAQFWTSIAFQVAVNGVDLYPGSVGFGGSALWGGSPATSGIAAFATDGAGAGGQPSMLSLAIPVPVVAGVPTTIKIRTSVVTSFGANPGYVIASADSPLFMTVLYK
jgi:hypothetical protein